MLNGKKEELEELRKNIILAIKNMSLQQTFSSAHDTIMNMINESEKNENKMNFIITTISENITKEDKNIYIKILSLVCEALKDMSPYLQKILIILQSNITDDTNNFSVITSIFGEIVENIMRRGKNQRLELTIKSSYEILQEFCISNIRKESKVNQTCGVLFLTTLIETCPLVLQPTYMKLVWESMTNFIDKQNFNAKSELLNALISLIFAAEGSFKPYSRVTLYKILDFLTDTDWVKRKLALNVVYSLIIYCQEEILPLKAHIIDFLRALKYDKVKEVREVCMQTLKLFNEDDVISEVETESNNEVKAKIVNNTTKKKEMKSVRIKTPLKSNSSFDVVNLSPISASSKGTVISSYINSSRPPNLNKSKSQITSQSNLESRKLITSSSINTAKNVKTSTERKNVSNSKSPISVKPIITQRSKIEKKINLFEQELNNIRGLKTEANESSRNKSNLLNNRSVNFGDTSFNQINNNDFKISVTPNQLFKKNSLKDKFVKDINLSNDESLLNTSIKVNRKDEKNQLIKVNTSSIIETQPNKNELENSEMQLTIKETNSYSQRLTEQDGPKNELDYSLTVNRNKETKENYKVIQNTEGNSVKSGLRTNNHIVLNPKENIKNKTNVPDHSNKKQEPNKQKEDDKIDYQEVLKQVKILSEKQIYFMETIDKYQMQTRDQLENMNNRILKLENTFSILLNTIYKSGVNVSGNIISNNLIYNTNSSTKAINNVKFESNTINKEDFDSFGGDSGIHINKKVSSSQPVSNQSSNDMQKQNQVDWSLILQEIKNKNFSEAFLIALKSDETNLLKLTEKISSLAIKDVDKTIIEDFLSRLLILLSKGQNLLLIISVLKYILITLNYELKQSTYRNIKDILQFISNNKDQFSIRKDEIVDINLILLYINSKNRV